MFPTHDTLHKENCLKPGPWSGQKRGSKHAPKPPTTPTFQGLLLLCVCVCIKRLDLIICFVT